MNRLRRNWLLMLDEPRYRGDRGTVAAAPLVERNTIIIDCRRNTVVLDCQRDTVIVDCRRERIALDA
jgi:hypothetical protein